MINVMIVDDDKEDRGKLKECLQYVTEKTGKTFSVREFSSGERLLGHYDSDDGPDILFLDIEMGGMDGLETARNIRKMDKTVTIIFVTNMAQLVLSGYEVEALDFIIKPLDKNAFLLKMTRALGRIETRRKEKVLISSREGMVALRAGLITWLEVDGHYIIWHSREGVYSEYSSLGAAEKKLNDRLFVRCNRSNLVNLRYVDAIAGDTCVVDGETLFISRPTKKSFLRAVSDYLGGGV